MTDIIPWHWHFLKPSWNNMFQLGYHSPTPQTRILTLLQCPWQSHRTAWSACEAIWCSYEEYSWEVRQQWGQDRSVGWREKEKIGELCITSPLIYTHPYRNRYPHCRAALTKIHVTSSPVVPYLCRCHALLHHPLSRSGGLMTCVTGNDSLWWEEDTSRQWRMTALIKLAERLLSEWLRIIAKAWRGWFNIAIYIFSHIIALLSLLTVNLQHPSQDCQWSAILQG